MPARSGPARARRRDRQVAGLGRRDRAIGGSRLELLTAALAHEVNQRAEQIKQLTQLAKDEGLALAQAPLSGAAVDGVMRQTAADSARRFHVQHAQASRAWVIHDAALLKADVQVGQRYRIA